jgi:hypothetical protein
LEHFIQSCKYSCKELFEHNNKELQEIFTSHTSIKNERYNGLMLYFEKVNASIVITLPLAAHKKRQTID